MSSTTTQPARPTPTWTELLKAPTFVINMDACPDRMELTTKRVIGAGYTDVRRLAAIDARTCDLKAEWAVHGSPPFSAHDGEFVTYPGKQCCLLSWLKMLQHIITEQIPYATVFEDDVLFHKDYATLAPAFYESTPKDYDMVYLGSQIDNPHHVYEISRTPVFCTHALMFSLAGAQRLYDFIVNPCVILPLPYNGTYTIDCMMKDMAHLPPLKHAYKFYVWNAIKFHDPSRSMSNEGWTKRNCGLVYQDDSLGTFVREWND